jgi:hypothetical protein
MKKKNKTNKQTNKQNKNQRAISEFTIWKSECLSKYVYFVYRMIQCWTTLQPRSLRRWQQREAPMLRYKLFSLLFLSGFFRVSKKIVLHVFSTYFLVPVRLGLARIIFFSLSGYRIQCMWNLLVLYVYLYSRQCVDFVQKFLTNEIGQGLWYIYQHSTMDYLRATALSVGVCTLTCAFICALYLVDFEWSM